VDVQVKVEKEEIYILSQLMNLVAVKIVDFYIELTVEPTCSYSLLANCRLDCRFRVADLWILN